jgi:cobyrinic acid a,c-diamide synthase
MNEPQNAARGARALLVSACASGQGKTTLTAALALAAQARGEQVRLFKTGADFIDAMVLEAATGTPVWQLDLFMGGEAHCRELLWQAAGAADWVLVEGAMGLYDGAPSSADLAQRFGLPVLAVVDAGAMAGTFGAVALGLRAYRPGLPFAGVAANRVAGEAHARMLFGALPAGMQGWGWLPQNAAIALPERHLGLSTPRVGGDTARQLQHAASAWQPGPGGPCVAPQVRFEPPPRRVQAPRALQGRRVAVARDDAFCFLYPANLALLEAMGARLHFFSPLAHQPLSACDALWLPGGYPELHAARLASHPTLRAALAAHQHAGKPLLAECGGMMALFEQLTDLEGRTHAMWSLLPGATRMLRRLAGLGLQSVALPEGECRGHSFHHSVCDTPLQPIARAANPNGGATAEAVYRTGRTTASYLHLYFPSNPEVVGRLFGAQ